MSADRPRLTLDPKRWYRGLSDNESALLRQDDGRMCCLGFECIRRGQSEERILGKSVPSEVVGLPQVDREQFLSRTDDPNAVVLETDIAGTNDDEEIPLTRAGDEERVAKLQAYFDLLGVELVLADDPDDYDRSAAIAEQEALFAHRRNEREEGAYDDDYY